MITELENEAMEVISYVIRLYEEKAAERTPIDYKMSELYPEEHCAIKDASRILLRSKLKEARLFGRAVLEFISAIEAMEKNLSRHNARRMQRATKSASTASERYHRKLGGN
ncbi:hypothetical protein [Paenibacillus sp. 453mf]|uniref:hypothetical protein n=1 Tax=Paenibacillus sp. 453mf TaxID=1761874 RepID=UPI0008DFB696|nr:hypothetical protein [Paenibacillus sp. 453mf]SFS76340.1 hypothetical protein SAMN04488601_10356 [Paenibacillus sp. 453mf]